MTIPHASLLSHFNLLRFQLRYGCVRAQVSKGFGAGWGREGSFGRKPQTEPRPNIRQSTMGMSQAVTFTTTKKESLFHVPLKPVLANSQNA